MTSEKDVFELARTMRGMVPEFDDSYIEKWIPEHIMDKILDISNKTLNCEMDDDGFWWGPSYMWATKVKASGETIVVIADKPLGMGHHELKAVDQHGNVMVYEGHHVL